MDDELLYVPEPASTDEQAGPTPNRQLQNGRLGTSLCFAVNGCSFATWVSRIPLIKHQLALTDSQLGFALFALAIGALMGFPLAGFTCARFGSKAVSVVLGFGFALALALLTCAQSLAGLMLALTFFGVFHGGMDVAMNANGVEVERRYGRSIMSSLHGMYSLGGLFGATVGLLATGSGVSTVDHLLGASILFVAVMLVAAKVMFAEEPTGHMDHPIFAIPSKPLLAIGVIVTCSFLCEGAMADWSGVYLRETLKTSAGFAVAGFWVFSLMMTLSRFMGDRVLTRFGPVKVLRYAGSIAALGFAVALLLGNPIAALVGFGCVGLGMSSIAPIGFGAAGRTEGMTSGSAIAAVASMGYSGFLIGPPIIGLVAQNIGLRTALAIVALLAAAIVFLAGAARHGQPTATANP
jgi:MFS family permease